MKNKLIDLNDHLFAQLERLNDETLDSKKLSSEIQRGKVMAQVAREVINNAALALEAHKFEREIRGRSTAPAMLGLEADKS